MTDNGLELAQLRQRFRSLSPDLNWNSADFSVETINHIHKSTYSLCFYSSSKLEPLAQITSKISPTPLIVLSQTPTRQAEEFALEAGASDYLSWSELTPSVCQRLLRVGQIQQNSYAALQRSRVRYRILLDSVREIIFQSDGQKWTLLNRAWEVTTGFAVQESIGRPLLDYIYPDDRPIIMADCADLLACTKEMCQRRLRLLNANGLPFWVEVNARAIRKPNGEAIGITGSFFNIQEHKKSEEEQQRIQAELAEAIRSKDEFLASMSHELRTPLNAILGKAELMLEGVNGPLTHNQRISLHIIQESGHHLLSLINDILDLAKIEAGKIELTQQEVSIESLTNACLRQVQDVAYKKELVLYSSCAPEVSHVYADERRLRQILINLLSNAVKFTPIGGEVGLEVEVDKETGEILFRVRDTGIGISEEDIEKLFQRFVQVDNMLSRKHSGTGLGLALVKHLTQLHDGRVTVESLLGEGSCFTIRLPASRHIKNSRDRQPLPEVVNYKPSVGAISAEFTPNIKQPLILIAEDNEMNITMLKDYLEAKGYRVAIARNGLEAVQQTEQLRPHLVLMDMQMPQMDGLSATKRIRANPQFAQLPIISLTALVMPGDKERCLAAGASAYMSKPISLRELVTCIDNFLNVTTVANRGEQV